MNKIKKNRLRKFNSWFFEIPKISVKTSFKIHQAKRGKALVNSIGRRDMGVIADTTENKKIIREIK